MPYAKCRKQWKSYFQKWNFLLKFRPDTTDPPKNMWKITTFEKISLLPHFVILPWWVIITKEARSKVDCHCCFVINRFRNRCWILDFFWRICTFDQTLPVFQLFSCNEVFLTVKFYIREPDFAGEIEHFFICGFLCHHLSFVMHVSIAGSCVRPVNRFLSDLTGAW